MKRPNSEKHSQGQIKNEANISRRLKFKVYTKSKFLQFESNNYNMKAWAYDISGCSTIFIIITMTRSTTLMKELIRVVGITSIPIYSKNSRLGSCYTSRFNTLVLTQRIEPKVMLSTIFSPLTIGIPHGYSWLTKNSSSTHIIQYNKLNLLTTNQ